MRIYLKLSPNIDLVPFNYQRNLVGAFHRWIGKNELHDDISLYSLSWLSGGKFNDQKTGLNFKNGAIFFISAPTPELLKDLIYGINEGTHIKWGMKVREIIIKPTPDFGNKHRFFTSSPVFIQRHKEGEKNKKYYFYSDKESTQFLTETLRSKLKKLGITTDVSVRFDNNYYKPKIRKITFNNLNLKASSCPVIIEGNTKAISFAWDVGVGNSTGIGFGSLK